MLNSRHDTVSKLIFELSKLPGIGEKTASRLTYFILKQDEQYARSLSEAILNAKQKTGFCERCFNFSDTPLCRICSNLERDLTSICIVEKSSDILAIEQAGTYRGTYHVLHGSLSPLDGIGPRELKIEELLRRIRESGGTILELIFATNPSVEGEATALYLAKLFRPLGIRLTKLAHGLSVGGLLEYTDRQTLSKAMENRVEMT